MTFYYLATPYSKYPGGIERAHADACAQAALLIKSGVPVYSPIAHTHPIAIEGDIDPFDHQVWLEADRAFMETACGLIVCEMDGWRESYGIEQEIRCFAKQGKPRIQMTPGIVPDEVKPGRRRIIGLCGYATAGKDTAAQTLIADGWTRVALADGVREAVRALNPIVDDFDNIESLMRNGGGWDKAKHDPEVRRLLQRMGTEAGRNIHGEDCWLKIAKRKIDAAPNSVVITDVRFANEAEAIRSWGGKIIRIDRPGVGPINGHASERLPFDSDCVIKNDDTIETLHGRIECATAALFDEQEATCK